MSTHLLGQIDTSGGSDACWPWLGYRTSKGYGYLRVERKNRRAHRLMWELFIGPIPEGMCVCHSCDNPPCCNPAHLFLGTIGDNNADMVNKGRDVHSRKTHCPQGHPYDVANTYVHQPKGWRYCRACRRARHQLVPDQPVEDTPGE